MTINDVFEKTVVALGMEEKPQHSIAILPCLDRELNRYSFFLTFSHLEDDRYDFGEEIPRGPEDVDPDDLIAAVFFAGERDWNNFVKLINSSDAKIQAYIKETREKENEK